MLHSNVQIVLDSREISLAPGESRSIPILVVSQDPQEQFVELQVMGLPADWVSLHPQVVHLQSGGQQQANLILEPPAQPNGIARRYLMRLQAAIQGLPEVLASAEANVSVAAFQTGERIGILLPGMQFSVSPGGHVTIPLTLVNNGLQADIFRLHVDGLPVSWVSSPAVLTQLEPGEHQETELTIQPPKTPQSEAGRHPFTVRVESRDDPGQLAEAACILTVAAYSQFNAELLPREMQSGQVARVTIHNEGNIPETFHVTFISRADPLLFEAVLAGQEMVAGKDVSQNAQLSFAEIRSPLVLKVPAGTVGEIVFRARPVSPPLLGDEVYYPFSAVIEAQPDVHQSLEGQVLGRAWMPRWVIPALLLTLFSCMCLFSFLINTQRRSRASQTQTAEALNLQIAAATQTAAFHQTQAVAAGQVDSDGDGLTNDRELELGSDPNLADSDSDELLDGPEVDSHATNPLNPDSDGDGLSDGEEVLRRGSNPLSPDSDQDGLGDGDEVRLGTALLNPDSDGDGLNDGVEVQAGTDPLNPDSDSDRLPDGRESAGCPSPLNPDTDGDGIIDGLDLEPCDPANPALTATAGSGQPTATLVPATAAPTSPPAATATAPPPTVPPTSQPSVTPAPGALPGRFVFESDRDGNPEIYAFNPDDSAVQRITDHPASDTRPSWSPDGSRIVFASNRDGNYEIYSVAVDGTDLIRLTDSPAEDTDPRWSPDSSRIVFASNRDGNREIYVMNADGSNLVNLTQNPADDYQPFWYVQNTVLVLETEWILFTSTRDGNQEIYSMLPDGGEQINLSNHPADDSFPVPLRNGIQVAFVSVRDGNQEVYVMDSNGAMPENLTLHPAADLAPYPSPDQAWLAFATDRDGNWEIYALHLEDGTQQNVTSNPANEQHPAWFTP